MKSLVELNWIFLLSLLFDSSNGVQNCPQKCQCWGHDVHCSGKGISSFPAVLPERTIYLFIESNSISEISSLKYMNQSDLHTLTLQYNKITYLLPKTFSSVFRLHYLNISFNNLRSISRSSFTGLTQLTLLSLIHNKIRTLAPKAFSDLYSLRELFLSYNQISNLPRGLFSSLKNLRNLYLDHNFIQMIADGLFENLAVVNVIDLSHNLIRHCKNGATRGLDELRQLNLEGNMINALENPSSAVQSNCPLNSENEQHASTSNAFYNLKKIETINLRNNSITTIKYSWFSNLKKLKRLFLTGNHWRCDCFLKSSLIRLTHQHGNKVSVIGPLHCHEPQELRGLMIEDLTLQDVSAPFQSKRKPRKHVKEFSQAYVEATARPYTKIHKRNHSFKKKIDHVQTTSSFIQTVPTLNKIQFQTSIENLYQNLMSFVEPSKKVSLLKRFSQTYVTQKEILNHFTERTTEKITTSYRNKYALKHNVASVVSLVVAIIMSIATISSCTFFILCRNRSRGTNIFQTNKCCFGDKSTFSSAPQESARSYTSYPLVYDNPLAQRPLPRQPVQLSSNSYRHSQQLHQGRNDQINIKWTCGGTFGLGERQFSTVNHPFSPFNSNDLNNSELPPRIPPRDLSIYQCDLVNDKAGKYQSHLFKTQNDRSNYLVPMSSTTTNDWCQQEKTFQRNQTIQLDNLPVNTSFGNVSPNYLKNDHLKKFSNQANRDRILEKMLEVLHEIDALEESSNRNDKDLKQSWYKITHKYLQCQMYDTHKRRTESNVDRFDIDGKVFDKVLSQSSQSNDITKSFGSLATSLTKGCNATTSMNYPKFTHERKTDFSSRLQDNLSYWDKNNLNLDELLEKNCEFLNQNKENHLVFNMKGDIQPFTLESQNNNFFSKLATNHDGKTKNVSMASYVIKESEYKSKNSKSSQDRRDSSDSMFVSIGCSSNDSEEEKEDFKILKKNKAIKRHQSSKQSRKSESQSKKLANIKNKYRRSMPIYGEPANDRFSQSNDHHLRFANRFKHYHGSNLNLSTAKIYDTEQENSFSILPHNKNRLAGSIFQEQNNKNAEINFTENETDKADEDNLSSRLVYRSNVASSTTSSIEDFFQDEDPENCKQASQKSLAKLASYSHQNRKVSVSSLGTVSVSSVEFQSTSFLFSNCIKKKFDTNEFQPQARNETILT